MFRARSLIQSVEQAAKFGKSLRVTPKWLTGSQDRFCSARGPLSFRLISSEATKRAVPQSAAAEAPPKEFSQIPGPRDWPVIGSLPTMAFGGLNPQEFHLFWSGLFEKYGPLVKVHMPGLPVMVGSLDPADLEVIMKSTLHNPLREGFHSLKKIRTEEPTGFFDNKSGILIENGEEWWRVRSRVQAPLLKPKNVAMYLPKVDKATKTFVERIDMLQNNTGKVPEDFLEELYKWALECVGLVALNKELGCLDPDLPADSRPMKLIETVNNLFGALNETEANIHWWKLFKTKAYSELEKHHNEFLQLATESLDEAMESLREAQAIGDPDRKLTVLETFLQTEGLSKSDVATIILDMLFAGIDTTSHTVAFTLYCLAKNPDSQKKLQEEIDRVMEDSSELLPEHIASMKYLNRVLREALRLYPLTLGLFRNLEEDIILSGYKVPAGCMAAGFSMVTGRDEKYFKRPNEFIPDRWDRDRPLGEIHPYASLPFSTGTRMCIGKRIAEQEIYAILIRTMQKYSVILDPDVEMKIKTQLVMKPAVPLPFEFRRRN